MEAQLQHQGKIWGIGMTADDSDARCPEKWKGEIILGSILMELRQKY